MIRTIVASGGVPDGGSREPRNSAMKPSPYTDRYSRQQIDHFYGAGLWSSDTFQDLLARQVQEHPDKVFATDGTRALPVRELFDAGQRLAVGLHRHGLRRGDTAAVQLPNWVEFIQVLAALSRLGVIMVPIMPIYRREDVSYVLSNAGGRAVFCPATFNKFVYLVMYRGLRQEHPDLTIVVARPDSAADDIIGAESGVFSLQGLEADTDDGGAKQELDAPAGPGARPHGRRRQKRVGPPPRPGRAVRHCLHLRNHVAAKGLRAHVQHLLF